jgi:hypothetical protein
MTDPALLSALVDAIRNAGATEGIVAHHQSSAETDMQQYFRVSPPSVHQMVLTLERQGFIRRQPRTPRSIELLVDPKQLPELL